MFIQDVLYGEKTMISSNVRGYKRAVGRSSLCLLYNKWCFQMTDMLYSESRPHAHILTPQYVSSDCVYCSFQQCFRLIMNHIQKYVLRDKIYTHDLYRQYKSIYPVF